MNTEPVAIVAALQAVIVAALALAALIFGWSAETTGVIEGVAFSVVMLAGAVVARARVWAPASVAGLQAQLAEATSTGGTP